MSISQLLSRPRNKVCHHPEERLARAVMQMACVKHVSKKHAYRVDSAESFYLLPLSDNLMLNRINGVSFGIRLPQRVLWPIEPEPEVELVVRCNGEGEIGLLSSQQICLLMHRSADMRLYILKSLLTSSTYLTDELEQYACNNLTGRIAKLLLELSEGNSAETINYSHAQLAELLNAQRESVSMIIGQFRRNRWVETSYGCIVILDSVALNRLATNY